MKVGDRVRVTLKDGPVGMYTGTVSKIRERPFWPSGADVVVDLDDMEAWRKAAATYPQYRDEPTFRRDQIEPLDS